NKGVSTDADAMILRERELEALPNEPEALAAALQAMAGPTQGENGPQVKVSPVAIRKPASIKATSAFTFRTSGRCGRTSRFHRACVTKTRTTSTAILISRRASALRGHRRLAERKHRRPQLIRRTLRLRNRARRQSPSLPASQ